MTARWTTTRLAGLATILALPVVFPPGSAAAQAVPSKVFRIYNNSLLGPIYPVISTPKQGKDEWLQAVFEVPKADLTTRPYGNDHVYRIYINPTTGGIPPGGFVVLKVPLYTQILPTDTGLVPDEFVNWWKGGRTSLYDVQQAIERDHGEDTKNPTTPIAGAALVTCTQGCLEPLAIYHSATGRGDLPANDPAQLTEYTLGGINEKTDPIDLDTRKVDYDISYVDQVYLPVAMEAVNNFFIGWIGTIQSVGLFKGRMQNFLDSPRYPGWPTYLDNNSRPILRIPSTAVIYASESGAHPSPDLSTPGPSFNATATFWKSCTGAGAPNTKVCNEIKAVEKLWLGNYATYQAAWTAAECIGVLPPAPDLEKSLLPHIYGWADFNEAPPDAKCKMPIVNEIYNTPGYEGIKYQEVQNKFKDLQYETPGGVFNPYVQLVHFKPLLDMTNAYSFSIDDVVGNMDTVGTGLIFAVGGVAGLPNKNRFDNTKNVEVTVGAPGSAKPQWLEYGFCTKIGVVDRCAPSNLYPQDVLTFNLQTVTYPTAVTLLDSNGQEYKFIILKGPPYPPAPGTHDAIQCVNLVEAWCQYIRTYTDATTNPKAPVNAVVGRATLPPS